MAMQRLSIVAGPSEMQLMQSLMRGPNEGPFGTDMQMGTSVHFTYGEGKTIKGAFSASIRTLTRVDSSGHRWYVDGEVVGDKILISFRGRYDSKSRTGQINMRSKS